MKMILKTLTVLTIAAMSPVLFGADKQAPKKKYRHESQYVETDAKRRAAWAALYEEDITLDLTPANVPTEQELRVAALSNYFLTTGVKYSEQFSLGSTKNRHILPDLEPVLNVKWPSEEEVLARLKRDALIAKYASPNDVSTDSKDSVGKKKTVWVKKDDQGE